jgi:hypothetical protein
MASVNGGFWERRWHQGTGYEGARSCLAANVPSADLQVVLDRAQKTPVLELRNIRAAEG